MAARRSVPAMCRFVAVVLVVAQLVALTAGAKLRKTNWLTLDGKAPMVVARGGFSGLLPDSSPDAYSVAMVTSVPNVCLWCDVQLTKDGAGICFPSLTLDNSSNIKNFYSKDNAYTVDGNQIMGIFTIDYTLKQLRNVSLTQGIYSRAPNFDDSMFPIMTVQDVFNQSKPSGFWVNVQHDAFFSQHKLSMQSFILGVLKSGIPIDYLSSPEIGFLRGIAPQLKATMLVFCFLGQDETEPTTNQTYGSLIKNLKFIKNFAAGILVPKSYIWPFDSSLYLQPHTTLVHDAHAAGLLVFAADFANDNVLSYNYSYNPVAEYLHFIDNGDFSVDGLLSDFPITPSEAIDCFAHLGKNASAIPLTIISHYGASGDYPSCTDSAYSQAVLDGADMIDCPVQMSKDGVPFCLSSINLMDSTNIVQTQFLKLEQNIPELHTKGIFSFNLTWKEIQGLTPEISNPDINSRLYRNPKNKNVGKLVSLTDFLGMAKSSTILSGVIIKIEHAAYLAQKQGMSVIDAVLKALDNAGYTNHTAQKVMIQSTDSSVLEVFKGKSYKLAYEIEEDIRDVQNSTVAEINGFADIVVLTKESIYPEIGYFTTAKTSVVDKFHASNLSVFVGVFRNEFTSQDWDFFSDPIVELNSFAVGASIDGVITDYPKTAALYRKNRCLNRGNNTPSYMLPVQAGSLLQLVSPEAMPPADAPAPVLSDSNVSEPPLPPVVPLAPPSPTPSGPAPKANSSSTSDGHHLTAALSSLAVVVTTAALLC